MAQIPERSPRRGRLRRSDEAPATGEHVEVIADLPAFVVEEILSGTLDEPVDFDQDHDEWVILLEGEAELAIGGEVLRLTPGDWLLIPADVAHRLTHTDPGTRWLAVHAPAPTREAT